jgi:hypothetical protein
MLMFYKQQSYFSQIVSKIAKITISFSMKNSKNNNINLGFSFMYLVQFIQRIEQKSQHFWIVPTHLFLST